MLQVEGHFNRPATIVNTPVCRKSRTSVIGGITLRRGTVRLTCKGRTKTQISMPRQVSARLRTLSLSQRMLVILAAGMLVVSVPAALVFYFFTRDAAIEDAERFAATSADRRVLGLNYTLRLATTSLSRFDLMLRDSLAVPPIPGEVE